MLKRKAEGHVVQIQRQAEGQVSKIQAETDGNIAVATSQVAEQITALTGENFQLSQDRGRLQFAAQSAVEEVQRLRSEVDVLRSRTISPSECGPNPFPSPAQGPPTCPTPTSVAGSRGKCQRRSDGDHVLPCCGFHNVVGRPSCWKCDAMINATIANNGADLTHARSVSGFVGQMQAASVVPWSFIASKVPLPCASNAATAQGCAFIAAKPGSLVSGGMLQ